MYQNIGQGNELDLGNIGNFQGNYWSSTEDDFTSAWAQFFANGTQFGSNKGITNNVRTVRTF